MADESIEERLAELGKRVEALEAVQALHDLISGSLQGVDRRDPEAFRATWWDDSVWNLGAPFDEFVGLDQITQAGDDVIWGVWSMTHHLLGNIVVTLESPDTAAGVCEVIAVAVLADGLVHTVGATYHDRLSRRGGEWRIARRDVTTAFVAPMPGVEAQSLLTLRS